MSPNSSTSSFDAPRRYLAVAAATAATVLAAIAILVAATAAGRSDTRMLVNYQQRKIERTARVDTIFVGDSSLGNGISSAAFDRMTGTHSLNLALTGAYGFTGSFNMIRRALAVHPEIRNVVVMQNAAIFTSQPSFRSYLHTTPRFRWSDLGPVLRPDVLAAYLDGLLDWRRALLLVGNPGGRERLDNDYLAQGPSIRGEAFTPGDYTYNDVQRPFLDQIADLCRTARLNCLYAHGPHRAVAMPFEAALLSQTNATIRASGIDLAVDRPMEFTEDQMGDSDDHIAPGLKDLSTAYYAERLKPRLLGQRDH